MCYFRLKVQSISKGNICSFSQTILPAPLWCLLLVLHCVVCAWLLQASESCPLSRRSCVVMSFDPRVSIPASVRLESSHISNISVTLLLSSSQCLQQLQCPFRALETTPPTRMHHPHTPLLLLMSLHATGHNRPLK